jgi:hypothetical protein
MILNQLSNVNLFAILVAFFVFFMLGYVWYQLLFVKAYKVALGKENEELPKKSVYIIGPAVCCIIYILTSAILIYALNITSLWTALEFALVVGIGYLVTNTTNIAINPNIPKPFLYSLISGGYFLLSIILVSFILVLMK